MTFADVFPFCFQFKRLWLPLRRIRLWLRRLLWRLLRRLLRTASYATGSCPCSCPRSCPSPRQYVLKCGFFHCHTLGPAFSHFVLFYNFRLRQDVRRQDVAHTRYAVEYACSVFECSTKDFSSLTHRLPFSSLLRRSIQVAKDRARCTEAVVLKKSLADINKASQQGNRSHCHLP